MVRRRAGSQAVRGERVRTLARVLLSTPCVVATLAAACGGAGDGVRIERAALVVPAGGSLAALYFTVHNGTSRADTVHAVRLDGAEFVTMHAPREHATGIVDLMADAGMVPLPPRGTLRFLPGGMHAMARMTGYPVRRGAMLRLVVYRAGGDSTVSAARVVEYAELDSVLDEPSLWARVTKLAREVRQAQSGSHCAPDAAPDPAMGRELYLASGCASCHGPVGRGDGPVAKTLTPPPRDFRDSTAFKAGTTPAAIAQTIAMGIPGGGAMPAFPYLNESERQSLALYITSLRPSGPRRSNDK